jgi:two-component system response regulator HydG
VLALVVDDERGVRLCLSRILARAGFEVSSASDGATALQLLRDQQYGLITLDLSLGGRIDGMDLLRAARARFPCAAIIMLTAHSPRATAAEAVREDVDAYLYKPLRSHEFLGAVQEAIDRRAALREADGPGPDAVT